MILFARSYGKWGWEFNLGPTLLFGIGLDDYNVDIYFGFLNLWIYGIL